MSIKSRNTLKAEFVAGTAATASKFEDVFDSHFNRYEDSVLAGPLGLTGTNGLVGPAGATFYTGLWLDGISPVPSGPTSVGATGQVIIGGTSIYICTSTNNWLKIDSVSF